MGGKEGEEWGEGRRDGGGGASFGDRGKRGSGDGGWVVELVRE